MRLPGGQHRLPERPGEILDGGRFGPLVPVGDAPRLAAALAAVLDNSADMRIAA